MKTKKYLTSGELEKFLAAARKTRNGVRDYALALTCFRHGLRVSELIDIRLSELDLSSAHLFVRRSKNSLPGSHPVEGDEMRALRAWLRLRAIHECAASDLLFLSTRGPFTRQAMNYLFAEIGKAAALAFRVTPHMLRHSCGYYLANRGTDTRMIQEYLGHSNIQNTVIYTAINPDRFKTLFR